MKQTKHNLSTWLWNCLICISLGFVFFTGYGGFSSFSWSLLLWNVGYSLSIGLPMFGFGCLLHWINQQSGWIDWIHQPKKSVIVSVLTLLLYGGSIIFFMQWFWFVQLKGYDVQSFFESKFALIQSLLIFVTITFVTIVFQARAFLEAYRNKAVEGEELKREALALQYEVAKNQISPHFLFNALNTAQTLVDIDASKTKDYLQTLAHFYRDTLSFSGIELISISDEIAFVKKYVYLQSIRFGTNLKAEFVVKDSCRDRSVIPLTLQLLVENAVKHNVISSKNPLVIVVNVDCSHVSVSNVLCLKSSADRRKGTGLSNLSKRYEFLTNKEISVVQTEHEYKVIVPLVG